MSVEHCDLLRPSLKAKLQDAGLLSIDDIARACDSNGNNENNNNNNNNNNNSSADPSAALLQERCPLLTPAETAEVMDCLRAERDKIPATRTLQDLLDEAAAAPRVTTFCRALDILLGGGVPTGSVSELCGPPGAGKTQFLLQLAVSCALPRALGGLGGGCLFVDTEGSFVAERFREIAAAAAAQVRRIIAQQEDAGIFPSGAGVASSEEREEDKEEEEEEEEEELGDREKINESEATKDREENEDNGELKDREENKDRGGFKDSDAVITGAGAGRKRARSSFAMPPSVAAAAGRFTADFVMRQTQYARVPDAASLMALLYTLPDLIAQRPELRMIVVDSVAFPFRVFGHLSGDADVEDDDQHTTNGNNSHNNNNNNSKSNSGSTRELLRQRSRLLFTCGQLLQETAREHEMCVVVSNHMTSRLTNGPEGESMQVLVPALGDTWAYGVATRLLITHQHFAGERRDGCHENVVFITAPAVEGESGVNAVQHRVARLVKSPSQLCGQCCFSISQKGIRDVFRPSIEGGQEK